MSTLTGNFASGHAPALPPQAITGANAQLVKELASGTKLPGSELKQTADMVTKVFGYRLVNDNTPKSTATDAVDKTTVLLERHLISSAPQFLNSSAATAAAGTALAATQAAPMNAMAARYASLYANSGAGAFIGSAHADKFCLKQATEKAAKNFDCYKTAWNQFQKGQTAQWGEKITSGLTRYGKYGIIGNHLRSISKFLAFGTGGLGAAVSAIVLGVGLYKVFESAYTKYQNRTNQGDPNAMLSAIGTGIREFGKFVVGYEAGALLYKHGLGAVALPYVRHVAGLAGAAIGGMLGCAAYDKITNAIFGEDEDKKPHDLTPVANPEDKPAENAAPAECDQFGNPPPSPMMGPYPNIEQLQAQQSSGLLGLGII